MSIVVHSDEPIENALKRLHREAIRENIFEEMKKRRYFIKPTVERCITRKQYKKTKKRRRTAKRKQKK